MNKLTIPMHDNTDGLLSDAVRAALKNGASSRNHDDNPDLFILEDVSDEDAKAIQASSEDVHVLALPAKPKKAKGIVLIELPESE